MNTTAPAPTVPAEDLATKLARSYLPHFDKLLDDAHRQGPAFAWALHLDPTDIEAKASLDRLAARMKAWQAAKTAILSDPGLPPALVEQFSDTN